jgi:DNA-binding transcriptional ArsR family regulator
MSQSDRIEVLKALADLNRRRLVGALLNENLTVNSLALRVGLPQYQVSKHLGVLKRARIVQSEARWKERTYSIVPELRPGLSRPKPVLDFGWSEFVIDGFIREV